MSEPKKPTQNDNNQAVKLPWMKGVFPDAQGLFSVRYPTLNDIKGKCFVALDANVLLLPYKLEELSLADIVKVYRPLADDGRLIIPAQAAREYTKNRSSKVAELVHYLRNQASLNPTNLKKKVGALEDNIKYKAIKSLAAEVSEHVKKLRRQINELADEISADVGDDPVSNVYRELFNDAVVDDPIECQNQAAFKADMDARYKNLQPPGYEDRGKPDGGYGDLLLWKTILYEGKRRNSDCILVTLDGKPDWFVQSDNSPFQPRIELLEEYRAWVGKSIRIIPLSALLKLYQASDATVDDVKRIEDDLDVGRIEMPNYGWMVRIKEREALDHDLRRTEDSIRQAENQLSSLPPFDGNMSLPWNRAHRQTRNALNELYVHRDEIRSEMAARGFMEDPL